MPICKLKTIVGEALSQNKQNKSGVSTNLNSQHFGGRGQRISVR